MKKILKKTNLFTVCLCFLFFLATGLAGIYAQTDETINLFGDVNGDEAVDIVDALLVAQAYVGLYPANFNENTADVNIDLNIDIVDALFIAQYYVGLLDQLPGQVKYAKYQEELSVARDLWLGLGATHYEYIFQRSCFCPDAGTKYLVEVDQDTIVAIKNLDNDTIVSDKDYSNYPTILSLFDHIQNIINTKAHIMGLEFHEIYKYPSIISVDQLIFAIDDEYSYTLSEFRSLESITIIPSSSNTQQGDSFGLLSAKVTGDILTISINYSGGCMEHEVAVFASDAFLESYPPQVQCRLKHDDPGDPCDAIVSKTEGFDLAILADLYKEMYQTTGTLILNLYSFEGEQFKVEYDIK